MHFWNRHSFGDLRLFALAVALGLGVHSHAFAGDTDADNRNGYEQLEDAAAAAKVGNSYNDYTRRLTEAGVAIERIRRQATPDSRLLQALQHLKEAGGYWDQYIDAKVQSEHGSGTSDAYLQVALSYLKLRDVQTTMATTSLDEYAEAQKEASAAAASEAAASATRSKAGKKSGKSKLPTKQN